MNFTNANFAKTISKIIKAAKIKSFSKEFLGGVTACHPPTLLQNLGGGDSMSPPYFFTKFKGGVTCCHPPALLVKNSLAFG